MTFILDPTDEREPVKRRLASRPKELSGRLALLDIRKPRGNVLLDRLEKLIVEQYPAVQVTRYAKPTFTKPAPETLRREIKQQADLVVEALAD